MDGSSLRAWLTSSSSWTIFSQVLLGTAWYCLVLLGAAWHYWAARPAARWHCYRGLSHHWRSQTQSKCSQITAVSPQPAVLPCPAACSGGHIARRPAGFIQQLGPKWCGMRRSTVGCSTAVGRIAVDCCVCLSQNLSLALVADCTLQTAHFSCTALQLLAFTVPALHRLRSLLAACSGAAGGPRLLHPFHPAPRRVRPPEVPASLPACLPACLPAYLPAYLPACRAA
jgi:hypothetical protein